MLKPRTLAILLGVAVLIAAGRIFFNAPLGPVSLGGESVVKQFFGRGDPGNPLFTTDLRNTVIATWAAMAVVLLIVWLATRRMELVPRGWQNFVEATLEFLLGLVESIAGKTWGRRVFAVVATIFVFVIAGNYFGLLPIWENLGKVEPANEVILNAFRGHEESHVRLEEALHKAEEAHEPALFAAAVEEESAKAGVNLRKVKLFLFDKAGPVAMVPIGYGVAKETTAACYLHSLDGTTFAEGCAGLKDLPEGKVPDGKVAGLLVPYIRSTNTDMNSTLAVALVAMFMVELWGIQAHGMFGYGGRFLNLKALMKGKVIDFLVGGLESISEVARVISFTFRLFGNMFAGLILVLVFTFLLPFVVGIIPYALELFVGFIQAAVFAMLALVFAATAVAKHEGEGHAEKHE